MNTNANGGGVSFPIPVGSKINTVEPRLTSWFNFLKTTTLTKTTLSETKILIRLLVWFSNAMKQIINFIVDLFYTILLTRYI